LKDQLVDLFCAGRSFVFHSATCGGLYYDVQTDILGGKVSVSLERYGSAVQV